MKSEKLEHSIHLSIGDRLDILGSTWTYREKIDTRYRFIHGEDSSSELTITTSKLFEALECGEVTITYRRERRPAPAFTRAEFIAGVVEAYFEHSARHGKPPASELDRLLYAWSNEVHCRAHAPHAKPLFKRPYPTPSRRAFLARLRRLSVRQEQPS